MVTAKIIEAFRKDGKVKISYSINTNGEDLGFLIEGENLPKQEILSRIKNKVKEFENNDFDVATILGNVDLTPAVIQAPSEISLWLQKYAKFVKAKNLVTLGVITGNEPAFVSLLNEVKQGFKIVYLELI